MIDADKDIGKVGMKLDKYCYMFIGCTLIGFLLGCVAMYMQTKQTDANVSTSSLESSDGGRCTQTKQTDASVSIRITVGDETILIGDAAKHVGAYTNADRVWGTIDNIDHGVEQTYSLGNGNILRILRGTDNGHVSVSLNVKSDEAK